MTYTEDTLEKATIDWFRGLGYEYLFGPDLGPDGKSPERKSYSDVVLVERLKAAVEKFNPRIPEPAREDAIKQVLNVTNLSPNLIENNKAFHKMLRDGVNVEYKAKDGTIRGGQVYLISQKNPESNEYLVVNQYRVEEGENKRRPDIVVFINGLPLAVFELKNLADEKATIKKAYNQFQTYKNEIPSLFAYNELIIGSDGNLANLGTITSPFEWFMKWRTTDGETIASRSQNELKVLVNGIFQKERFLDLVTNYIHFSSEREKSKKIVAGYHQYFAANKAVESTRKAAGIAGNQKAGVIWHTQGSGKSLTMLFYAGKLIQKLNNPTLVVLTDRNDLDNQLFETFTKGTDLLRQTPKQVTSRADLKEKLKVSSGGVVFTTIQKFQPEEGGTYPELSKRKNIVVIADEAHRTQYGFQAKSTSTGIKYGLAKYVRDALPNAAFIGFTATPIALKDRSTVGVFGEVVDTYDISRAIEDHATVPIYYEARLAKIDLPDHMKPKIDEEFEEITEGEEIESKEKLKSSWARVEKLVGSHKRLALVAKDIVDHHEKRTAGTDGKAMIVTMSRRIAVDLYDELVRLRPDWGNNDDSEGVLKVIISGSASDPEEWQKHIRSKAGLEGLANRFKDPKDPFKIAIVRDMWLTGFDAPCLRTMYVDKPMQGHNLMQAIARVNRVHPGKEGGLIVDYIGLAAELKKALSFYSDADRTKVAVPQDQAIKVMNEKYEIVKDILSGFEYDDYYSGTEGIKTDVLSAGIDYVLGLESGAKDYTEACTQLSKAYSLAIPHPDAIKIRDEVLFFEALKAGVAKLAEAAKGGPTKDDYDIVIKQMLSDAVTTDKIINIFEAAGVDSPDISILSEEFLENVQTSQYKNIAIEALRKLLEGGIRSFQKRNLVAAKRFSELLEDIIAKYQSRAFDSTQVILELVELAKKMKKEISKGKELNLSDEEIAFYDALAENKSAVALLGDKTLRKIAKELVELIRENASVDWSIRESVQAKLRVFIKKLLSKYDYPPDKQKAATETVIKQAELMEL